MIAGYDLELERRNALENFEEDDCVYPDATQYSFGWIAFLTDGTVTTHMFPDAIFKTQKDAIIHGYKYIAGRKCLL